MGSFYLLKAQVYAHPTFIQPLLDSISEKIKYGQDSLKFKTLNKLRAKTLYGGFDFG